MQVSSVMYISNHPAHFELQVRSFDRNGRNMGINVWWEQFE